MTDRIRIDIDNGKYTVVQPEASQTYILRHGEPWLGDNNSGFAGSNAVLAMAYELEELREKVRKGEEHAAEVSPLLDDLTEAMGMDPTGGEDDIKILKAAASQLRDANEVYVDRRGTVWRRPTAWAYFASCRILNYRNKWLKHPSVEKFLAFTEKMAFLPDRLQVTSGSHLAGPQMNAGDCKQLRNVLQAVTGRASFPEDDNWDAMPDEERAKVIKEGNFDQS
jgi:hypothetical protein